MLINVIQHIHYEGPGLIRTWAHLRGYKLKIISPSTDEFAKLDARIPLIILGGPMGVYEKDKYPWLEEEKAFILKAIRNGAAVLGICLGSQLIASALGANVYPNVEKEIGWFPVYLSARGERHDLFSKLFKVAPIVFHWHGDTFDLPDGAENLVESECCTNQAFLYGVNVLGIQFHLEVETREVSLMVENGKTEISIGGQRVQNKSSIMEGSFHKNGHILSELLDNIFSSQHLN